MKKTMIPLHPEASREALPAKSPAVQMATVQPVTMGRRSPAAEPCRETRPAEVFRKPAVTPTPAPTPAPTPEPAQDDDDDDDDDSGSSDSGSSDSGSNDSGSSDSGSSGGDSGGSDVDMDWTPDLL